MIVTIQYGMWAIAAARARNTKGLLGVLALWCLVVPEVSDGLACAENGLASINDEGHPAHHTRLVNPSGAGIPRLCWPADRVYSHGVQHQGQNSSLRRIAACNGPGATLYMSSSGTLGKCSPDMRTWYRRLSLLLQMTRSLHLPCCAYHESPPQYAPIGRAPPSVLSGPATCIRHEQSSNSVTIHLDMCSVTSTLTNNTVAQIHVTTGISIGVRMRSRSADVPPGRTCF